MAVTKKMEKKNENEKFMSLKKRYVLILTKRAAILLLRLRGKNRKIQRTMFSCRLFRRQYSNLVSLIEAEEATSADKK